MKLEQYKIKDICIVGSSKRIFANEYVDSGIPFYRSKEIIQKHNNEELTDELFISEERYEEIKVKNGVPQAGDLLLTSVGTLGIPYLVKNEKFYFKDGNLTWFYDFNNHFSSKYLYYYLNSSFGKNDLIIRAIGSSQPALTIDILKKFKVSFPNIDYQNKIVSILDKYDSLIKNNNKRIQLLEQTAQEIYKEWFVRFRFPGHKNVKFENGIPKDWKLIKFIELGEFVRGKNITTSEMIEGIYPVISAGIEPSGYHNEYNVIGPSITVSSSGANAGHLKFNYMDIWAADCSYLNEVNNIYFIYELLNNQRLLVSNLQKGAAQPHVYAKDINKLKVLLPPLNLITKANDVFRNIHNEIKQFQLVNKNLIKQRDLLLPRLMSGKLEVK